MTGYGNGSAACPGGRVSAELRSVNHRFLELRTFIPREFLVADHEFREQIEERVKRGKLDFTLTWNGRPARTYAIQLNVELARAYRKVITQLQREIGLKGDLDLAFLSSRPDLFTIQEQSQGMETLLLAAKKALHNALDALDRQRLREGKFIQRELRTRVAALEKIRQQIQARSGIVQEKTKERLKEKIPGLLQGLLQGIEIDQSRLLQEVATLAQRGDITEEVVRLQSHLKALSDLLRQSDPVGKRIDFLLQEVQREVNTIGSKADDVAVRHLVVSAKEEVEKLREQVQNVE
jgi:uncharacterized protein (TIGR00255 family)